MKEETNIQSQSTYQYPRVYLSQTTGVADSEQSKERQEKKTGHNEYQAEPSEYKEIKGKAQSTSTLEEIFFDNTEDTFLSATAKVDDNLRQAQKQEEAAAISSIQSEATPKSTAEKDKGGSFDSCNNRMTDKNSQGNIYEQQVHSIEINKIVPNPNQPRKSFPEFSILKLADSIQQFGIIQPLTVRKIGEEYELIAGERRLRAAKEIGLTTVPCIIISSTEEKSAQISIIENLIREDLNIFEQALAIETLIDTYGLTQEQVAKKLSSSQSFVANKLRLLRLSTEEREDIIKNGLTERHARSLLRIKDTTKRQSVLDYIVQNSLNVNEAEIYIDTILNGDAAREIESTSRKRHEYKDSNAFYNAIIKALDCARYSELPIKTRKIVGDSFTEITIIIPNSAEKDTVDSCQMIKPTEQG